MLDRQRRQTDPKPPCKIMKNKIIMVFITCPDEAIARQFGQHLVGAGLAACVNVVPGVSSIYRWQDKVQQDQEAMMMIKTAAERLPEITAWIRQNHPYDLPEVVAVPVVAGHDGYLQWVNDAVAAQE